MICHIAWTINVVLKLIIDGHKGIKNTILWYQEHIL